MVRRVGWSVLVALTCAALLGSAAGRAAGVATGDTCVATGSGTAYTLQITIPSTAPQQFGFAFGASGTAVTNIVVPGSQGAFSTHQLPSGSSGAWITMTPLQPGSATASLTTSAPVTGKFSVMPASDTSPTYFEGFQCSLVTAAAPSSAFTVAQHATYVRAKGVWHLTVAISGAGAVHAASPQPSVGLGSVMAKTTPPLVKSHVVALKSAGKATLALTPTARGLKTLAATGKLRVRLDVTFDPKGGKSASKLVWLTLRK